MATYPIRKIDPNGHNTEVEINKPVNNKNQPPLNLCMYKTPPVVKQNPPNEPNMGHGLGSTKW